MLNMENGTTTYREMYDAEISYSVAGKIAPERDSDPTYWHRDGEISFTIERTHRLALDRPSVTAAIPAEKLGIGDSTPAAADFALRSLKKHADKHNAALVSRRPDYETGRFYVYEPGGEVLTRNAAYFAMREGKAHCGSGPLVKFIDGAPPPRMCLCLLLQAQLPRGKLKRAMKMLTSTLPDMFDDYLAWFDIVALGRALELERKQNEIREWLRGDEYSAFIANGSVLAREKGTAAPMENAVPFVLTRYAKSRVRVYTDARSLRGSSSPPRNAPLVSRRAGYGNDGTAQRAGSRFSVCAAGRQQNAPLRVLTQGNYRNGVFAETIRTGFTRRSWK